MALCGPKKCTSMASQWRTFKGPLFLRVYNPNLVWMLLYKLFWIDRRRRGHTLWVIQPEVCCTHTAVIWLWLTYTTRHCQVLKQMFSWGQVIFHKNSRLDSLLRHISPLLHPLSISIFLYITPSLTSHSQQAQNYLNDTSFLLICEGYFNFSFTDKEHQSSLSRSLSHFCLTFSTFFFLSLNRIRKNTGL